MGAPICPKAVGNAHTPISHAHTHIYVTDARRLDGAKILLIFQMCKLKMHFIVFYMAKLAICTIRFAVFATFTTTNKSFFERPVRKLNVSCS